MDIYSGYTIVAVVFIAVSLLIPVAFLIVLFSAMNACVKRRDARPGNAARGS